MRLMNRAVIIIFVVILTSSFVAAFPVVESVDGQIWDVHSDRLLYLSSSGDLRELNRISRQETVITSGLNFSPQYGYLTPSGAMFMEHSETEGSNSQIYDWRGGQLFNLGRPNSSSSLKVKGNYAIWSSYQADPPYGTPLILRNLVTGINVEVSDDCGNNSNDVASDGTVVYWSHDEWSGPSDTTYDYNIFRYRDGTSSRLTDDSDIANTYPLTDGGNVVYRKSLLPTINDSKLVQHDYQTVFLNSEGELILSSNRPAVTQGIDYQINNGWVAFTDFDENDNLQVWTISPSGEMEQVSDIGGQVKIDALGPNGELTFQNGSRTYLATHDSAPLDVGPASQRYYWRTNTFLQDGQWYAIDGGTLSLIPEPATLGLIAICSGGLYFKRRFFIV